MSKKKAAKRKTARKKAAPKPAVNGKSAWLVQEKGGDVLVFSVKPTMQEPYTGAAYKTWREPGNQEYLASFCGSQFRDRTGIAVPDAPIRVRLSVVR